MSNKEITCPSCGTPHVKLMRKYTTVHVYKCQAPKCGRKFDIDAVESKEANKVEKRK